MPEKGHGWAAWFSKMVLSWLKAPRVPPAPPLWHGEEQLAWDSHPGLAGAAVLLRHLSCRVPCPHLALAHGLAGTARWVLSLGGAGLESELLPGFAYIMGMLQAAENSKCCFNYVL